MAVQGRSATALMSSPHAFRTQNRYTRWLRSFRFPPLVAIALVADLLTAATVRIIRRVADLLGGHAVRVVGVVAVLLGGHAVGVVPRVADLLAADLCDGMNSDNSKSCEDESG